MKTIKELEIEMVKEIRMLSQKGELSKGIRIARLQGKLLYSKEVLELIDEMRIRGCSVWGKFKSNDWVIENSCSKDCKCEVCDSDEIYILDVEELKQRITEGERT